MSRLKAEDARPKPAKKTSVVYKSNGDVPDDFDYDDPFPDGAEIEHVAYNGRHLVLPKQVEKYCEAKGYDNAWTVAGFQQNLAAKSWKPLRKKNGGIESIEACGQTHEIWVRPKEQSAKIQREFDENTRSEPGREKVPTGAMVRSTTVRGSKGNLTRTESIDEIDHR